MRRLKHVADYEMWVAAHDDCGPEGCGGCVFLEFEVSADLARKIRRAAHLLRIPVDVFLFQAVSLGLAVDCA